MLLRQTITQGVRNKRLSYAIAAVTAASPASYSAALTVAPTPSFRRTFHATLRPAASTSSSSSSSSTPAESASSTSSSLPSSFYILPPLTPKVKELLRGYFEPVPINVAWGDMDSFGHVNNAMYPRWCEVARIHYMMQLAKVDLNKLGKGIQQVRQSLRDAMRNCHRIKMCYLTIILLLCSFL